MNKTPMKITVDRGSMLIVAMVAVGYLCILFSVLNQTPAPAAPSKLPDKSNLRYEQEHKELIEASRELDRQKQEIKALEDKLNEVNKEIVPLRQFKEEQDNAVKVEPTSPPVASLESKAVRPGVIILGMHRSGTSIVGGLMNKMGLKTGGPLIRPWKDNEKGFFERIDVVLQNDYIMRKQRIDYSLGTWRYDTLAGVKEVLNHMKQEESDFFNEGRRGLAFLNDPANYPWMLKDPRLCITVRTWLPLLNFVPAILFTYRHPMDVAMSMHKRETEMFQIGRAMRLWYVYNKRALQQSQDLCRVTTSHRKMMAAPQEELDRIYNELHACGVAVPKKASSEDINEFIDLKLQHGHSTQQDKSCEQDSSTLKPDPKIWDTTDPIHIKLYQASMKLYCALEDGSAYDAHFRFDEWIKDE